MLLYGWVKQTPGTGIAVAGAALVWVMGTRPRGYQFVPRARPLCNCRSSSVLFRVLPTIQTILLPWPSSCPCTPDILCTLKNGDSTFNEDYTFANRVLCASQNFTFIPPRNTPPSGACREKNPRKDCSDARGGRMGAQVSSTLWLSNFPAL